MRGVMPPSLMSLVDDPVYRRYIRTIPTLPDNISHGSPWAVWAVTRAGKWRGGKFGTYREAWGVVVKALRNPRIEDVSIVSRRKLFRSPGSLAHLVLPPYEWCPRCRRPSMYQLFRSHHAIEKWVPMDPGHPRCIYCGLGRQNDYS